MGKAEMKAMEEAVQLGESKAQQALQELETFKSQTAERERQLAQCHEVIGRIQAADAFGKLATVSTLVWLRDMKEAKIYRDLPNIGTWDKFCEYLGKSRRLVDEQLMNLEAFGQDFLETVSSLKVGYRELKSLRQLTHEGAVTIDGECVRIGEEEIDLDDKEALQAAIENIIAEKVHIKEEAEKDLKAKDRLLKDKEMKIQKQARQLTELEQGAEKKGLTAEEDAFLQQMANKRVAMDGFLLGFDIDRNPLPDNATPRMKAAFMETLGYLKRSLDASHDTAADLYGDPEIDDAWVPPHLRTQDQEPGKH